MADTKNGANGTYLAPTPQIFDDFFKDVSKGFIEDTFEVQGRKFRLKTPNEDAEVWADNFIRPGSPVAFLSSRRVPRLATAIQSINGLSVDTMFVYPAEMPDAQKKALDSDPVQKQYWVWSQLMANLAKLPTPVVEELYNHYQTLIDRRAQALTGMAKADPNASTRTPGGESVAMS